MKNNNIGSLLLLIFFAGIFPQQYFIFMHDHEHAVLNITQEGISFHEKDHDCTDQLNYLSIQTNLDRPAEISSFRPGNYHFCCLLQEVNSNNPVSETGRAPPVNC